MRSVYDVRVQSLIVESDGRVAGITARQFGKDITVRACRGVVLATGSFAYNDAMVAQYAPRIAGKLYGLDRTARRCGHPDGAGPGRRPAHMDATEVAIFIEPQQLVRGILVNARGQRYVAEDTYPGRIGQLTLYHQDDTAYLIIDGDAQEEAMAAPSPHLMMRPPTSVCETVAELETEIGLPRLAAGHGRLLQRRRVPRRGSVLHKKAQWLRPIGSPVGAIDLRNSTGASPSAGWPPRCRARCCTSAASRSPACSPPGAAPRAWPRGVMPAGPTGRRQLYGRRARKGRRPRLARTAGLLHSLFPPHPLAQHAAPGHVTADTDL